MPRFAIAPLGLTTEGSTKFKPKGWKCYLKKLQFGRFPQEHRGGAAPWHDGGDQRRLRSHDGDLGHDRCRRRRRRPEPMLISLRFSVHRRLFGVQWDGRQSRQVLMPLKQNFNYYYSRVLIRNPRDRGKITHHRELCTIEYIPIHCFSWDTAEIREKNIIYVGSIENYVLHYWDSLHTQLH